MDPTAKYLLSLVDLARGSEGSKAGRADPAAGAKSYVQLHARLKQSYHNPLQNL